MFVYLPGGGTPLTTSYAEVLRMDNPPLISYTEVLAKLAQVPPEELRQRRTVQRRTVQRTIGVEREATFVGPDGLPKRIRPAMYDDGLDREAWNSMGETASPILYDMHAIRGYLQASSAQMQELAGQYGGQWMYTGTHPLYNPARAQLTEKDRYLAFAKFWGLEVMTDVVGCGGTHVTIGGMGIAQAIDVHNQMREWLVQLAAPFSASAFFDGRLTQLKAGRLKRWLRMDETRTGIPRHWESLTEAMDYEDSFRHDILLPQILRQGRQLWFYMLFRKDGSLELRMFEAAGREATQCMVALALGTVETILRLNALGIYLPLRRRAQIQGNLNVVAQGGLDARINDPIFTDGPQPVRDWFPSLIKLMDAAGVIEDCDIEPEIEMIERELADPLVDQLINLYHEKGMSAVLNRLLKESTL